MGAILRAKELNIVRAHRRGGRVHGRALSVRLRLAGPCWAIVRLREIMDGFRRHPNIFSSHIRSQSGQTRTI